MIADKAWGRDGQLWFNPFQKDGFVADRMLVNWAWKPRLDVRARRYRLRIVDASVARYLALGLVKQVQGSGGEYPGPAGSNQSYDRVPFHLIANDGNVMEHTVAFDGKSDLDGNGNADEHRGMLPTQAIGERYDIVVDFGAANNIRPGDKLYLINTLEHKTGKEVSRKVPLADIVSERYKVINLDEDRDFFGDRYKGGDPAVGAVLQFDVKPWVDADGAPRVDPSMNPKDYEAGRKKMIPLPIDRGKPADQKLIKAARHRSFVFGHSNGTDASPWTVKTDGGPGYSANMRRITAAPRLAYDPTYKNAQGNVIVNAVNDPGAAGKPAELEVWKLVLGGGWSHPVHIHFEEGVILRRGGKLPPEWERWARKDLYRIGPESDSTDSVEVAIRFREFAGTFMEHCHNTTHEDNAMLLRWDVEHPGQVVTMPTPLPGWEGVQYVGSVALPTYRSGDAVGPSFKF
jgi:FtsP/CotA-like multicopper oxidase with cupredoxin domain